jgi:hypothetical protein
VSETSADDRRRRCGAPGRREPPPSRARRPGRDRQAGSCSKRTPEPPPWWRRCAARHGQLRDRLLERRPLALLLRADEQRRTDRGRRCVTARNRSSRSARCGARAATRPVLRARTHARVRRAPRRAPPPPAWPGRRGLYLSQRDRPFGETADGVHDRVVRVLPALGHQPLRRAALEFHEAALTPVTPAIDPRQRRVDGKTEQLCRGDVPASTGTSSPRRARSAPGPIRSSPPASPRSRPGVRSLSA